MVERLAPGPATKHRIAAKAAGSSQRLTVKASILRRQEILLVEYQCPGDTGHFSLPGGRIRDGEPARSALARKVREEICAEVEVLRLLLVLQYLPDRWNDAYGQESKIQLHFLCGLAPGSEPRMPPDPEPGHVAVTWVPLERLPAIALQPGIAQPLIQALEQPNSFDLLSDPSSG